MNRATLQTMKFLWTIPIVITLTGCPDAPLPAPNSPQPTTRGSVDPPGTGGQPVDREQQILEWTLSAESENKVGAALWQKGTWSWQLSATDKTGIESLRTGYDSTHVRIFGDIRMYKTIAVRHYLRPEQWVRVSTRLVDCKRKVVENWPEGDVFALSDVRDPEGSNALSAEISAVCAAAPFIDSRPVGQ